MSFQLRNFQERRGARVVLRDVNLDIASGDWFCVIGPSGSGKTTLVRNLIKAASRMRVAYVAQQDALHEFLTVEETCLYSTALAGCLSPSSEDKVAQGAALLRGMHLDHAGGTVVRNLSGGERRRLSVLLQLLHDPEVLFLDEATTGLDPGNVRSFLQCVQALKTPQRTIVMATHNLGDLEYASNVCCLDVEGTARYCGPPADLLPHFKLDSMQVLYDKVLLRGISAKTGGERRNTATTERKLSAHSASDERARAPRGARARMPEQLRCAALLTRRYLRCRLSDRRGCGVMLAQSLLLVAITTFTYDHLQLGVLFLLAVASVWYGINNSACELVREREIWRKERRHGVGALSYLVSKLLVLSALAFGQVAASLGLTWAFYRDGLVRFSDAPLSLGVLCLVSFASISFGLLVSCLVRSESQAVGLLPILTLPQVVLAGIISELNSTQREIASYFIFSRWGTECLAALQDRAWPGIIAHYIDSFGIVRYREATAIQTLQFYNEDREYVALAWFREFPALPLCLAIVFCNALTYNLLRGS